MFSRRAAKLKQHSYYQIRSFFAPLRLCAKYSPHGSPDTSAPRAGMMISRKDRSVFSDRITGKNNTI